MEGAGVDVSFLPVYLQIILLAVSVIAVAFFSSAEASLISVNKFRIRHLAEAGNRSAQAVNQHEKFFSTILFTENAFIILASVMGSQLALSLVGENSIGILLAALIMTVLIVQFGEITPKTLAAHAAERWSLVIARPIAIVMAVETYVIYLFTLLPRLILKVIGGEQRLWTPSITEGELRMLIDIGRLEGAVESAEAEMLEKVFHFGDRQVREIMTPRPDILWVEKDISLREFLDIHLEQAHTRFPVFEESVDNVIGILSIKGVVTALAKDELKDDDNVTSLLRPAYFVPETKTVSSLFLELRDTGHPMAMTVDEFGGIAGLATIPKLLEVIVGPVAEEGQPLEEQFETMGENLYHLDADMSVQELEEQLAISLPQGEYQTVAGFILERLGYIPQEGDHLHYENLTLTVRETRGVKVERVAILRHDREELEER